MTVGGAFAADTGFSFGDTYAIGLLFLGLAVFAAIGALSHQRERAFSASLIYLGLGVVGGGGDDRARPRLARAARATRSSSSAPPSSPWSSRCSPPA